MHVSNTFCKKKLIILR